MVRSVHLMNRPTNRQECQNLMILQNLILIIKDIIVLKSCNYGIVEVVIIFTVYKCAGSNLRSLW